MTNLAELLSSALAHHQAGSVMAAEQLYRQVLASDPNQPDALHLLGVLCMQSGRGEEAIEHLSRAFSLRPNSAEFANHLGAAYGSLKRFDEAVTVLRRAVQLAPADSQAHYNLGTALRSSERLTEAVASFRHAVAANPSAAEAHYNLANTLRDLGQLSEAEASYRDALAVRPGYMRALVNLGNVLRDQKRHVESIAVLRQAVELDPAYAPARLNLGTVLRDACQFDEAIVHLQRAVELSPDLPEAHNNLGTALQAVARFDEAGACYKKALRLDPGSPDAHFGHATWRLRQGDLAGGFDEFEWRWKCKSFAERGFPQPRWDGAPLNGRTVLLYAEQGLGDALHFVRYAAHAKRLGGRVIVECHPALVKLLGCGGAIAATIDELIAFGAPLPAFDTHAPLMSLPGILKLAESQLWSGPYLAADPMLVATWRDRLARHDGFRIGACWQGNPEHMFNAQRSYPLAALAPVARVPGVRLARLQKDAEAAEIAAAGFDLLEFGDDFDDASGPFMDSAAVIANLDLVITTDTAIAHLAGGLGARVWLALSAHPDWRWMLNREDTPWYGTMRLFRQSALGAWDDVFAHMAEELAWIVQAHVKR
jgi:tetratricopeptide (TPR) repeat protein